MNRLPLAATAIACSIAFAASLLLTAGKAHAEGDEVTTPHRPNLGAFRLPDGPLPPEVRRQVPPSDWRNLGAVACAAEDTDERGVTRCSRMSSYGFTTDNRHSGRYIVHLRAPASHCAPIIYVLFVDDGATPYYFGALYPGASASGSFRVGPGAHNLKVGALGDTTMGGCNTAGIQSWSVDLRLDTDSAPE